MQRKASRIPAARSQPVLPAKMSETKEVLWQRRRQTRWLCSEKSNNPDVIYGREFDDEPIPIQEISGEIGEVTIRGQIISFESREIRNERTILMFAITDFTDTIVSKIFWQMIRWTRSVRESRTVLLSS